MRILFVVNPKAGRRKPGILEAIRSSPALKAIPHEVILSDSQQALEDVEQKIRSGGFTHIVAVGGDGTVNRIASMLVKTEMVLGIIPAGSGNGLARSLGISMETDRAILQLVENNVAMIDVGSINGRFFFCTAGTGFDAHIGNLFASSGTRGLRTYVGIIARELMRYRAQEYKLKINGQTLVRKAFLITVANAGQYGNDFFIAPQANMIDGLFHVVVMKPFNVIKVAGLLTRILSRKAYLSSVIETIVTSSLTISREAPGPVHYDGEPEWMTGDIQFEMLASSLKVVSRLTIIPPEPSAAPL